MIDRGRREARGAEPVADGDVDRRSARRTGPADVDRTGTGSSLVPQRGSVGGGSRSTGIARRVAHRIRAGRVPYLPISDVNQADLTGAGPHRELRGDSGWIMGVAHLVTPGSRRNALSVATVNAAASMVM